MKKILNEVFTRLLGNRVYFLLALMIITVIVMSFLSPYFFTVSNLLGMTRFGAVLALVGMGQSLVILGGGAGIDLSVGSIVSLSGVFFGMLVQQGVNVWLAAVICVFIGAGLGMINGVTIALWGLPPLIGTLGTMWGYGALALVLTQGVPISGFPESFEFIGQAEIFQIPVQILLIVLPAFIVLLLMMNKTQFGRWVYLMGVNPGAAKFSGIPVKRVKFSLYTISGLLAGMGAVIMSSWLMTARPDIGSGMDMQSITVAVLGGIYIFGGEGSLAGTMLAILIVTMIQSGLQLGNINTVWQLGVLGFILLAAVALNQAIAQRIALKRGLKI